MDYMEQNLGFPEIAVEITPEAVIITSQKEIETLSSAIVGGGFNCVHEFVNWHVPLDYDDADPVKDLEDYAKKRGIQEEYVGMMTAAQLPEHAGIATFQEEGLTVGALITAGLSNPSCAGLSLPFTQQSSTINTIIIVGAKLTPAAFVNAVSTATEAKTHVLLERGTQTPEGFPATGTSTDSISIACFIPDGIPDQHYPLTYAGPATLVGYLIGRGVREALQTALASWDE